MDSKVDILILTAGFGTGHLSASSGIKEHILKIDPLVNIEILDVFQMLIPRLSKIMYKGYNILVKKNTRLYNYYHYKDNEKLGSNNSIIYNRYILNKLNKYILDIKPKLIISTFPVVSQYISKIKSTYGLSASFVTCITDVVNGWEWITSNCDKYFVATEDIKNNMINMGIEKEKIIVTGIPIRAEFFESKKSLSNFSLPKEDTVLMIMGGGMGLIPEDKSFYQWLNSLKNFTTLVLTGKNDNLFESISQLELENIIPLRYTNEVAYLMEQSDLLITKAGGITLFEAIASELPLIIYRPELGQELENTEFIREKSIGKIAFNIDGLQGIITDLIDDKSEIMKYKKRIIELKNSIDMRALSKESIELVENL